jgi:DNA polymerase-3 subunit gamma/tau
MSYLVLARKYRPQRFVDLVGQEHVAVTLKNAIKGDRTAHAYLFTGPRGVGKTSAARILAKALRCQNPASDGEPCNECESCVAVNLGNSLDVIEIDAASNTGVDNIRELRESVGFMATQGKYRIYIIDEVHMLSTAAFNALLKTLEEPPPHVLFVFATTEIHKVPATILSRCQRFDFKKIPPAIMVENLKGICAKEKIAIDENSLKAVAIESEGCLRDAQSLLDQAIAICGEKIELENLEKALGLVSRAKFFALIEAIFEHKADKALLQCTEMLENGMDPKILLGRLTIFFRDLHFFYWTGQSSLDDAYTLQIFEKGRNSLSVDEVVRALDLCLRTQTQLPLSILAAFSLESLVAKLCLQRPALAVSTSSAGVSQEAPRAQSYSQPQAHTQTHSPSAASVKASPASTPTSSSSSASVASSAISASAVDRGTQSPLMRLEEYLRQNKNSWIPVIRSVLRMDLNEQKLDVEVKSDFAGKRLASKDGIELLRLIFSIPNVVVTVEGGDEQKKNSFKRPEDILLEKRREAREHVAVQEAIKSFRAVVKETKVLNDEKLK